MFGIFALLEALVPVVAADFDVDDLFTIEPMLDGVAVGEDTRMVPFADGVDWFAVGGSCEFVKRTCAVCWILTVLVLCVVQDLVFESKRAFGSILYTAIACFGNLPIEMEFKVFIMQFGDDVATSTGSVDDPIFNAPSFGDRIAV